MNGQLWYIASRREQEVGEAGNRIEMPYWIGEGRFSQDEDVDPPPKYIGLSMRVVPFVCPVELREAINDLNDDLEKAGLEERDPHAIDTCRRLLQATRRRFEKGGEKVRLKVDRCFFPFLWFTWFEPVNDSLYLSETRSFIVSNRLRQRFLDNAVSGVDFWPICPVPIDRHLAHFDTKEYRRLVRYWSEVAVDKGLPNEYFLMEIWSRAAVVQEYASETCPTCGAFNTNIALGDRFGDELALREEYRRRGVLPPWELMATDMFYCWSGAYSHFVCSDLVRDLVLDERCDSVVFKPVKIDVIKTPPS